MGIEGFDEIINVFKDEVRGRLKNIEDGLIALQSNPEDQEILDNLQREAHTIKGAARMVGYSRTGEVAHALETLIKRYRNGEVETEKMVKAALRAVDYIRNAIEKGESDEKSVLEVLENPDKLQGEGTVEITKSFEVEDVWKFIPVEYEQIEKLSQKLEDLYMRTVGIVRYRKDLLSQIEDRKTAEIIEKLMSDFDFFRKSLHQLTMEISDLRLVPVSKVFDSITRPIYEIATSLGKKVKVNLRSTDIKIDKRILDSILDSIIHLIRNALDHGIEPPEERVKKGKPEYGTLYLSAFEREGKVVIQIEDDGRGIDTEQVVKKAVEKGIIDQETAAHLSEKEKIDLIFIHGFSTKEQVSDMSGRGVGMDVVKSRVEELGGEISVETTPGYGTRIELILPLTIATVNLIFFRIGEFTFAYPSYHVENIIRIEKNRLITLSNGRKYYDMGEERIPVVDLVPAGEGLEYLIVTRRNRIGYMVNEVVGEESVVIKRMSGPLKNLNMLKGFVPLSTENIAYLIDLSEMSIMESMLKFKEEIKSHVKPEEVKRKRILVVDDSPATREVVSGLLRGAGYEVVTAENGIQAMRELGKEDFDLVVTDINMPQMDGYELTKYIRETPHLKALPVIMLTSFGSAEERKKGKEVGADEYLTKGSFDPAKFLEIIRKYLEGR